MSETRERYEALNAYDPEGRRITGSGRSLRLERSVCFRAASELLFILYEWFRRVYSPNGEVARGERRSGSEPHPAVADYGKRLRR